MGLPTADARTVPQESNLCSPRHPDHIPIEDVVPLVLAPKQVIATLHIDTQIGELPKRKPYVVIEDPAEEDEV
jgi:hypothetical protein